MKKRKEVGLAKRNCQSEDYRNLCIWWIHPSDAEEIIYSLPYYSFLPDYIRESLEVVVMGDLSSCNPDYPSIVGLPRGMELPPIKDYMGELWRNARFIYEKKLIGIVVANKDARRIEIPPGFITNLYYKFVRGMIPFCTTLS